MQLPDHLPLFERAYDELKRCGIKLERLPGEYRINYHFGGEATARFTERLEDALREGRAMAKENVPSKTPSSRPIIPLTPKAKRRFRILTHNHKARAIWLKRHRRSD